MHYVYIFNIHNIHLSIHYLLYNDCKRAGFKYTFTLKVHLEYPFDLICMCLDCRRKLELAEETLMYTPGEHANASQLQNKVPMSICPHVYIPATQLANWVLKAFARD